MDRAIPFLAQLGDNRLFEVVSEGLGLIAASVAALRDATNRLDGTSEQARSTLSVVAEEEAAKVLVLLDVVRCPRGMSAERGRTLGYFYDHLAKGIYADVCDWNVHDFAELGEQVVRERSPYYLDGPNGVDWVFPNDTLHRRESALYVDYVQESGIEGSRSWIGPDNPFVPMPSHPRTVAALVTALHDTNLLSSPCLRIIADVWRQVGIRESTTTDDVRRLNRSVLERTEQQNLLRSARTEQTRLVVDRWPFPLYPLDLRSPSAGARREALRELRQRQAEWAPDI